LVYSPHFSKHGVNEGQNIGKVRTTYCSIIACISSFLANFRDKKLCSCCDYLVLMPPAGQTGRQRHYVPNLSVCSFDHSCVRPFDRRPLPNLRTRFSENE